ncbi:MAG: DUF4253 domain-containing protein [Armatimonadota bacterium]
MLKWLQGRKERIEGSREKMTHAVTRPAQQPSTPLPVQKVRMVNMLTGHLALKEFPHNQAQTQWLGLRAKVNGSLIIFADIEEHSELREPEAHAQPTQAEHPDYTAILATHKESLDAKDFARHRPSPASLTNPEPAKEFFSLKGTQATTYLGVVPVKEPWKVPATAAFGSWERITDDDIVTAHLKSWYEKYGATPALIGAGQLELWLDRPVTDPEQAADLALEMFSLCPDIIDEGTESTETLANSILGAHVWYFWWD